MAEAGTSKPSHHVWARAVMWIAIVGMILGAGLYVFRSLRSVPAEIAEGGRQALRELQAVAGAFRQGTITTSFLSYATEARGENFLQVATLSQMEAFERKEEASILWGQLSLPDVVVEAKAPVETTYYLDLNGTWHFEQRGDRIRVQAPELRFNTPAVDVSKIRFEVRQGTILNDTDAARENLRRGITRMARHRAQSNVELVRELARRKTAEFVENWLAGRFDDGSDYRVDVTFADELPPEEKTPRLESVEESEAAPRLP